MEKIIPNLSERDRLVVFYGGILAGLLLFYFLIWSPLSEKNQALIDSNTQTRELIDWMQKAKVQLIQFHQHTKNKSPSAASLLSTIEQSIKRDRLDSATPDIKQQEKNRVQITFANVDFITVMRWIEDVQSASASKIVKVTIQKTGKPGMVHLDITLER